MGWLKNAMLQLNKPQQSIIAAVKKNLGGYREGRSREQVHASDITKIDFCPRKWAFLDLLNKNTSPEFVSTAMDVTWRMGLEAERLLVEEWGGKSVIGNWVCRLCNDQRTMTVKPNGYCKDGRKHWWKYEQLVIEGQEYGVIGSLDAIFDVGAPLWMVTEVKTIKHEDFGDLVVPLPEHRIRTNLYMKLIENSSNPWKSQFNLMEARVFYISRGHGKMHPNWNEVLPFKELEVKRDDSVLEKPLARASQLKVWREQKRMPAGICGTALDKIAQKCSHCQDCFSGKYPAEQDVLP